MRWRAGWTVPRDATRTDLGHTEGDGMERLLAEDVILLCWDDAKGRIHSRCGIQVRPGVAGALVIDALLAHAIAVDEWRVRRTGGSAEDPLVREVADHAEPGPGQEPPSISGLVKTLSTDHCFASVLGRLVSAGVLRQERRRRLGFIPTTRFRVADPTAAAAPRETVRPLLTGHVAPGQAGPRAVLLGALARPTNAVEQLVGRSQRVEARRRAAALAEEERMAETVGALSDAVTLVLATTSGVGYAEAGPLAYGGAGPLAYGEGGHAPPVDLQNDDVFGVHDDGGGEG